jgi:imidazole glycerol-phosphate synthase subunit HisH
MIGIIDYGSGNILSIINALNYLGHGHIKCKTKNDIMRVDKLILPGVGAFPDCMKSLHASDMVEALNQSVLKNKIPILGICLGMQVMAKMGSEMHPTLGLGWIDAEVIKLPMSESLNTKIPNVGWEEVISPVASTLFQHVPENPEFYFVHSFYMNCSDESNLTSYYPLGEVKITSSIQRGNIFGTQFHPEKSSENGLIVLDNFLRY